MHTAVGNADSVRCAQEVLSHRHDLSTIADSNRAVVTVSVVVAGLLVVLEALHERHQICVLCQ